MKHYKLLSDLHRDSGWPAPLNPLFSIIRCTEVCTASNGPFTGDFYMVWVKKIKSGVILYGRTRYDHDNGCMGFLAPRQVIEFTHLEFEQDGFVIVVHEDYLAGHPLHAAIRKYGFFDYSANEALHLSPREEETMWELYAQIRDESGGNPDEYSREIILAHFDSLLRYCQRFYKRQFIDRGMLAGGTVARFNEALGAWRGDANGVGPRGGRASHADRRLNADSSGVGPEATRRHNADLIAAGGLPTVQSIARSLNISPRYLSDLLKQETGKTALELIHIFLIGEAKNLLKAADASVSETAYSLGFENLPYFSRLFKREVGMSPGVFKKQQWN
jgi:AraC family transcriptional regulator, transcriptional activator of pobA